jgi:hypothetical protein
VVQQLARKELSRDRAASARMWPVWYNRPHMAAKKITPKEIGDTLGYIVQHMATKDDITDIRKEMATKADVCAIVRDELAPIR